MQSCCGFNNEALTINTGRKRDSTGLKLNSPWQEQELLTGLVFLIKYACGNCVN